MNPPDPAKLADLCIEALERTAFVLAEPSENGPVSPPKGGDAFASRIAYDGEDAGEFFLVASAGFVSELTSSLLGVEPDEVNVAVQGEDAIRELANILGGSLILELGAEQRAISLGLPEICDPRSVRSEPGDITASVESIGESLWITWRPSQRASEAA